MVTLEDARMRIERAKLMIGSTRKSLCDISAECGFADQAHLTQCFRRIVGMTPGMWRHRHGFASVGAGESRSRKLGSSEVRSPGPGGTLHTRSGAGASGIPTCGNRPRTAKRRGPAEGVFP